MEPLLATSNVVELKPDKEYLLVLNGATEQQAHELMRNLRGRGLKNIMVLFGDNVEVFEAQPTEGTS